VTAAVTDAGGGRRALALGSLALGGFAIGCSEFVAMGVLPQVAAELAPAGADTAQDAVARVSMFVWGYALGVVLGAPVLGSLSSRFRRGRFVTMSLLAMAVLTLATSLVPGFGAVVTFRILSGIPHAAYFGVAAIVAAGLLGERHAARGVAVVIGGLTIANVLGVPAGTWLGQAVGWRMGYALIAALFALAAVGAALALWRAPERSVAVTLRSSLRALASGALWRTIAVYALVNAGLFAVLTFAAPVVTGFAAMPAGLLPVVLAVSGVGMTIGNYAGAAVADRSRRAASLLTLGSAALGFAIIGTAGAWPPAVFLGFAVSGFTLGCVTPFIQVGLMRAVPSHPQLGSSMNSLCANAGSVIGGIVGSGAILLTGAPGAPVLAGALLTALGYAGAALLARRRPVHSRE
jgi:MFS transporter, DHA1 family, inner membrane transport protein